MHCGRSNVGFRRKSRHLNERALRPLLTHQRHCGAEKLRVIAVGTDVYFDGYPLTAYLLTQSRLTYCAKAGCPFMFLSQHISVARALVLFATLTLNVTIALGQNDAGKTYRCTAKDAVSLQDNGTLGKAGAETRRKFDGIIIDTLTGAITYASGSREIWDVVQEGNSANDHVLIPRDFIRRDAKEVAAAAATDFIRVRAWTSEPQVKFMAFELSTLVAGTCEVVR